MVALCLDASLATPPALVEGEGLFSAESKTPRVRLLKALRGRATISGERNAGRSYTVSIETQTLLPQPPTYAMTSRMQAFSTNWCASDVLWTICPTLDGRPKDKKEPTTY